MANQEVWPLTLLLILTGTVIVYVLRIRNPKLTTLTIGPLFLYLVAGVIGTAQLFTIATAVLSVCVVCYVLSRMSLRGIGVTREASSPVWQGDSVDVAITVANRDWMPRLFLRVRCPLPEWLEAEQDTFVIPGLWSGQQTTCRVRARAARRGCYRLAPLELVGADPMDVFQRVARRDTPAEVLVYPLAEEPPGMELWGEDFFGGVPARRLLRPAAGLDFHSLRDYQPGDDVRTIDWKATARLSRLIVVGFEPTQVGDLVVLLDNRGAVHAGRGEHATLERAVSIAAGAAAEVLSAGGTVSVRYLGGDGTVGVSGRGRQDLGRFLDALARLDERAGSLGDVVPDDLRARTVLVITPATGPEVVDVVRRVGAAGGRAVVLLLDAESLPGGAAAGRPDGAGRKRRAAADALSRLGVTGYQDVARTSKARAAAAAAVLRSAGAYVQLVGAETPRRVSAARPQEAIATAPGKAVPP
ncbi:MAG: DUF58 domain-containing protein [Armatimonadetes bacterium]|nr:DUF58 domain-containing protein [Armatimonadota bacterium]